MEEKVSIKNKKNLNLGAIISKPHGDGPFPAVIILHGFTGYMDEPQLKSLARKLMQNNIVAIRFDFSGFAESEGTVEDYLFSNHIHDLESVMAYVKKLEYIDQEKIGLFGHSLGGSMAIVYGDKHPTMKAICAACSPTTLNTAPWTQTITDAWKRTGFFAFTNANYGWRQLPWAYMEDVQKYDAAKYVKGVTCPLLVVVGLADDVVDPKSTKEIFDQANEPKEIFEIPGMGHDYGEQPEILQKVNKKVLEFFQKYL